MPKGVRSGPHTRNPVTNGQKPAYKSIRQKESARRPPNRERWWVAWKRSVPGEAAVLSEITRFCALFVVWGGVGGLGLYCALSVIGDFLFPRDIYGRWRPERLGRLLLD